MHKIVLLTMILFSHSIWANQEMDLKTTEGLKVKIKMTELVAALKEEVNRENYRHVKSIKPNVDGSFYLEQPMILFDGQWCYINLNSDLDKVCEFFNYKEASATDSGLFMSINPPYYSHLLNLLPSGDYQRESFYKSEYIKGISCKN